MIFYDYLIRVTNEEGIHADFAYDAIRDEDFPKDVETWEKLELYLISKRADSAARHVAKELLRDFMRLKKG